jgi:hypothetical protein
MIQFMTGFATRLFRVDQSSNTSACSGSAGQDGLSRAGSIYPDGNAARSTQPEHVTAVLQVVQRVLTRQLLEQAGLASDEGHGGAVTLIQHFGSAAKLNIHGLMQDGVCRCGAHVVPEFVEVGAPTDDEVHVLLRMIITPLM